MTWRAELEKTLRNLMPYAFMPESGSKPPINEAEFPEFFGMIQDFVEVERKKAFFTGYASGAEDAVHDINLGLEKVDPNFVAFEKDLSRVGAEKAWLKTEASES